MWREQRKLENVYRLTDKPRTNRQLASREQAGRKISLNGVLASLKQGSILTQNIFPRDGVGNSTGFQDCLAAKNQEFIKIENGIAIMVKDDTFV